MFGWTGKILLVDLSCQSYDVFELTEELCNKYIGGRGLAGYFLKPSIKKEYNDPELPLVFMTGPLVGTIAPTSGRMCVASKSPLTNTYSDTSVGGRMPTELKKAGWDGIIFKGKSPIPVGVSIRDAEVQFRAVSDIKGLTVKERQRIFRKEKSFCCYGLAAENGVLFANIVFDEHYFSGRTGLGLVMHSKNLAFVEVSGSGKVSIFDENEAQRAKEDIMRLIAASPVLKGEMGISEYGTGALYDLMHARNMMPTDNFTQTRFDKASGLNAVVYKKKYNTRKTGCQGCPVFCKKTAADGRAIPEFETMSHFSALIGNDSTEVVMEANRLCNEFGMDTISTAAVIACWQEISGKTYRSEALLNLIQNIARAKDEGAELKLGAARLAELYKQPEKAITVKSLELPAYDPRGAYGMSLAYATSTRGGCHLRAYPIAHEILRKPVATDRFTYEGKARIIKLNEDLNAAVDSLTACKFIFFAASLEEYAHILNAVARTNFTGMDLLKTGERIFYNERIMLALCGFSAKDDLLPERFFTEDGTNIKAIDKAEFLRARNNYYKIRGLDADGLPTKEKSTELGLEWSI